MIFSRKGYCGSRSSFLLGLTVTMTGCGIGVRTVVCDNDWRGYGKQRVTSVIPLASSKATSMTLELLFMLLVSFVKVTQPRVT